MTGRTVCRGVLGRGKYLPTPEGQATGVNQSIDRFMSLSTAVSRRKGLTPIRSLSRCDRSGSEDAHTPQSQWDNSPGVIIRFAGEMCNIDDVPTFNLRIVHEQTPAGAFPSLPASPTAASSSFVLSRLTGKPGQLILKLPALKSERRTRKPKRSVRQSSRRKPGSVRPDITADHVSADEDVALGSPNGSRADESDLSGTEDDIAQYSQRTERRTGRASSRRHAALGGSNGSPRILPTASTVKRLCSSCGTRKTPYWREGWEPDVVLCNACGIRYHKYKRFCGKCVSTARKDENGRLHCPKCHKRL